MLFFSIYDEEWRSYRGKPVSEQWYVSPGACERLAVLNWRSSSLHPSRTYYYYCQKSSLPLAVFLRCCEILAKNCAFYPPNPNLISAEGYLLEMCNSAWAQQDNKMFSIRRRKKFDDILPKWQTDCQVHILIVVGISFVLRSERAFTENGSSFMEFEVHIGKTVLMNFAFYSEGGF